MKKNLRNEEKLPFIDILSEEDHQVLEELLENVKKHIDLGKRQNELMIQDYLRIINFYLSRGMSMNEITERIDPVNLGGFYVNQAVNWYPLDNAAIVYPLSMHFGRMPVFRLSVYLKEKVNPAVLQMALNFVIKRFPTFATTVKSGVFWHYLDSTKKRYAIEEERMIPCQPINVATTRAQSFRVIYYQNRISIELFHILADGHGALIFLNTLAAEYIRLLGNEVHYNENCFDPNGLIDSQEVANEFARADLKEGASGFMGTAAVQMSGKLADNRPCQVLHFELDLDQLKKVTSRRKVTVTAYILGLMFLAQKAATENTSGDIKVQVPIDMRKFNGSRTVRNYSMYFSCDLPVGQIMDLDTILPEITRQLKENGTQEKMNSMMSTTIKLIKSVRFVPLVIKAPVVQIVYGFLGEGIFSSCLSNLGVVRLDESLSGFIDKYDFVLGTSENFRATCSMISYQNKAVLSVSKMTLAPTFEEKLYNLFTEEGLTPKVTGSDVYES